MFVPWNICVVLVVAVPPLSRSTILSDFQPSVFDVEYVNDTRCGDMDAYLWSSNFHNCFIERKYGDGGRDLDHIIDRILENAKECVQASSRQCRPDFYGFKVIMGKVVEQMKDYAQMYLEGIHAGRENIKDLECVESKLQLETYERCFEGQSLDVSRNKNEFQKGVNEGIRCTNKANDGCSREAKSSLNRIVRNVFSIAQPSVEEDLEDEVKPTEAPQKSWYEYIADPFIYLWNAIKSWFG